MYTTRELYIALFFIQIKNDDPYLFEPDFNYDFANEIAIVYKKKTDFIDLFTGEKYKEISTNNWGKDKKRIYKTIPFSTFYQGKEIPEYVLKSVLENINDEYKDFTKPSNLYSINHNDNFSIVDDIEPQVKLVKTNNIIHNNAVIIDIKTKERRN